MKSLRQLVFAFKSLFMSSVALASPCTDGNQGHHRLLKSCKIARTTDLVLGGELRDINVCMSMIEKSGGPWGGDMIPWYFSNFSYTNAEGKRVEHEFFSPNGRHNFRSLIDYTVIELDESMFYMESHRTKYPANEKRGNIELHEVSFDLNSGNLRFDYSKRNGVMFGRWVEQVAFEAVCQD